jgi:hypothetical protein
MKRSMVMEPRSSFSSMGGGAGLISGMPKLEKPAKNPMVNRLKTVTLIRTFI